MSTTQNVKHFLSITPFMIGAWDKARNLLPSHSSNTPTPSPAVDLESQSPGNHPMHSDTITPMLQPALQPLHPSNTPRTSTAIDLESQLPETQAQPSLTLNQNISQTPETQQTPSPAINPQQIMGFCFQAATQIAFQRSKLPISVYLHSVSILLTFASLFVSQLISKKFPDRSKVLEKVAIYLAAIAFFTAIATPLALTLN